MPREGLTGSRIRERRGVVGFKQAELARKIGISASYLNLIEHNRRRIGGKLLLNIARVLGVEPSMLTEGAEVALIATLREAALDAGLPPSDAEYAEDFAGRFPGWAEAMARTHRRIAALERTIETLTDRLAHDPQLAASVHELLTTAAAIRATAAILAEEPDISDEWRNRFHANINDDSRRLADSSKALVAYLDDDQGGSDAASSPQEEVEAFLSANDYSFPELEAGEASIDDMIDAAGDGKDGGPLRSVAARHIARGVLDRLVRDAAQVPMARLCDALGGAPPDPAALSRSFDAPVPMILRRLASVPGLAAGLVVCDRSGSLIFRRPLPGFDIPRFGACCPLWPLFAVLGHPGQVMHDRVAQLGRGQAEFDTYAASGTVGNPVYNAAPLVQATMLILPRPAAEGAAAGDVLRVGSTCRVCPRDGCPGRREPSILSEGF